jgi:hypothetical protein
MKKTSLIMLLALGISTGAALAQDAAPDRPPRERPPGGPGGPGGGRIAMPLMQALDPNGDGIIDETEIAQASANLKKLDKNGDGKITREELRPVMPDGQRRPGGPDGDRPNRPRPPGQQPPQK